VPAFITSIAARLAAAVSVILGAITAPADVDSPALCLRPPVVAPVADPYRPPACTWCPGNRGTDYRTSPRTLVRVAAAGTVSFTGPVAGLVWVTVAHADDLLSSYGPMDHLDVHRGQRVVVGQPLGTTVGILHFGVRRHGRYIDPALVLGRPVHLVPRLVRLNGRIPTSHSLRCPRSPGGGMAGPRLASASLPPRLGSVPGPVNTRSILPAVARR
jgi:murein DD-endopeptidase MepM/ murein hydrolase activator NlpD